MITLPQNSVLDSKAGHTSLTLMDLDYNSCVHGRLDSCLANSHSLSPLTSMGGVFSCPFDVGLACVLASATA